MKRLCGALVLLFAAAIFTFAQDASTSKSKAMTGWVCDSKCVIQSGGKSTCDPTCTQKSGTAVFVSDKGPVMQIAQSQQNICQSKMGKHVKMMATVDEQQKELDHIHFLQESAP